MMHSKKQLFTASILATLIFYFMANGYRFFHGLFAGDSLYMIYQNNAGWEIALGRFVKPFLLILRGAIATPFLISVLAIFWISLSVYFVVDFLEIKRMISFILIAAIMSCNITVLSLNVTYLPDLDLYMSALFFSVFGVWLIKKGTLVSLVSGSFSLCISLGIYQSYICVSIALVMIHLLCQMPELSNVKCTFKKTLKYLLSFMAAAIIYYAVWKTFQKVFDIWTADSYNGLASVGDFSDVGIGSAITAAYRNVLDHFIYPETFITNTFRGISMSVFWICLIRLCNIAVVLMILFALIKINSDRKTNLWQKVVQLALVILFPFGINFVCFVSKGMEHALMTYAFNFVYVMAVKLAETRLINSSGEHARKSIYVPWKIVFASVMILSWSNIVYSNQVYLKRELQESAAQSIMTRIVYRIETMDGYIPGTTPVAFSGTFENSPCISDVEPFDDIQLYSMGKTVLTYPAASHAFLSYILNMNINLTHIDPADERIRQMPAYPAEGSVAYIDGILVVKLSE